MIHGAGELKEHGLLDKLNLELISQIFSKKKESEGSVFADPSRCEKLTCSHMRAPRQLTYSNKNENHPAADIQMAREVGLYSYRHTVICLPVCYNNGGLHCWVFTTNWKS